MKSGRSLKHRALWTLQPQSGVFVRKSFGLAGSMVIEWQRSLQGLNMIQLHSLVRPYFVESVDVRLDNWSIKGS